MTYNFDDYLNTVRQNIKNKKLHATICAELESHLQDSADFYVEIGYDEETANKKALEDMGEPATVGESMAKLHKLSGWQRFLLVIFFFVAILKVLDIVLTDITLGYWISCFTSIYQPRDAIVLSGEMIPLLITVMAGIAITMYTKRKAPTIMSIIILLLEVPSIWCFGNVIRMTVGGSLYDNLTHPFTPTVMDYAVVIILTAAIFLMLLFLLICVIRVFSKPFDDNRKLKRNIKIFAFSLSLILTAILFSVFAYVDHKDKEQFELYSRVVADMCDLCMEKGRITADDFEEVKERFDYLEIKEVDLSAYDIECSSDEKFYSAPIGDGLMINSSLNLSISSDGSFSFSAQADRLMSEFDLSFRYFKTTRILSYNNRWEGSDDASLYIAEYLDKVQQGDTIDGYLNKVKETGSDFSYFYDADGYTYPYLAGGTLGTDYAESDYKTSDGAIECYSTHLDTSDFFGQWYFDIYADKGKFVTAAEMID